jgi:hypothetical protein
MGRHGDKNKVAALPSDFRERDEVAQLIYWARQAARSITYTTWTLGIIAATGGVIFSSWVWLSVLAAPVIVNTWVVNNAHHRVARRTGLDAKLIRKLWQG